jgi:hypothetical protein
MSHLSGETLAHEYYQKIIKECLKMEEKAESLNEIVDGKILANTEGSVASTLKN